MRFPALFLGGMILCSLAGCESPGFRARVVPPPAEGVTRITVVNPVKDSDSAKSSTPDSSVIVDREAIASIMQLLAHHTAISGSLRTISSAPRFSFDVERVQGAPIHYEVGYDWMRVRTGESESLTRIDVFDSGKLDRLLAKAVSKKPSS